MTHILYWAVMSCPFVACTQKRGHIPHRATCLCQERSVKVQSYNSEQGVGAERKGQGWSPCATHATVAVLTLPRSWTQTEGLFRCVHHNCWGALVMNKVDVLRKSLLKDIITLDGFVLACSTKTFSSHIRQISRNAFSFVYLFYPI